MNKKIIRVLSLGAGVQSSTLALMAEHGEIEKPDCAIFADTQSEPKNVMQWLDFIETKLSYPVYRVTKGSLYKDSLVLRTSKKHGGTVMATKIPAYVKNPDGSRGIFGRKCTTDYKVAMIEKKVKELLGINRFSKKNRLMCEQIIGISADEPDREKPSRRSEIKNVYPLLDLGMTRQDCLEWMKNKGYPTPPKSSCTFCPFHSDEMWLELKQSEDWPVIVEFERELQRLALIDDVTRGIPYLHPSLVPIDQVVFKVKDKNINCINLICSGLSAPECVVYDMPAKRISDEVYAKTEQHRHEAEVRHVAKQKVPWIREHLGKVKEKRGEAEYHRLRNAVLIEYEKLKN